MKKMNKKGFTIVELVIVIAVIAILAGVMIPTFSGIVEKANQSAAIQQAEAQYKEDLVAIDAQISNYGDGYKKATAFVEGKTYYTATTVDGATTYSAPETQPTEATFSPNTYYEKLTVGDFTSKTDINQYTTTIGKYTVKYDGKAWTATKAGN